MGYVFTDTDTVFGTFSDIAERWPARLFLNVLSETAAAYGIAAGETTYGRLLADVKRLRVAYEVAGYRAGGRVMLSLESRPSFFQHWFALNALGLSVVPVNPDLKAAELGFIAGHARPCLAIAAGSGIEDLQQASCESGVNFPVIASDAPLPAPASCEPVMDLSVGPLQRESAMLYTSGTTGQPKGCVLANLYFLHAGRWYNDAGGLCSLAADGERMITPLPMFHMNAMACSVMAMVMAGGCLIALDRFHPSSWWASVRESRATCLHYLGVMQSILMQAPAAMTDRDHQVRFGFGAGVDPGLHGPFERRFGFPLIEAWAMTETGAGAVICANHEPRKVGKNCLGRPGPDVEVRIVGEDGKEAGPDRPGELLVRHAGEDPRRGFFTEYYKDQAATDAAWQGGWFHTGDIVRRDADGDMFFVDRKKNVIRRSGENIMAVEVESTLMRHPAVVTAGVAGVSDVVRGEEVFACLVINGGAVEDRLRDIVRWCLTQIAYYKVPGFVASVAELPLTSTQKIQRSELKALVDRLVGDPATVDTTALKRRRSGS